MYARLPDSCYQTSLLLSFQMVQDSRMTRQTNQKPNMTTKQLYQSNMFSIWIPIVDCFGQTVPPVSENLSPKSQTPVRYSDSNYI